MNTYTVKFTEWDSSLSTSVFKKMEFEAEDALDAINQLLEVYRNESLCVDRIVDVTCEPAEAFVFSLD